MSSTTGTTGTTSTTDDPAPVRGYRAGRAFDGERVLDQGALVLVSGRRIVSVQPATAPAPPGCPVTSLPGGTLLPGLVDAHVHLCGDAGPDALARVPAQTGPEREQVIHDALRQHLRAGVTTVRDLGCHQWAVLERTARDDEPRVVASGPPITTPGGHCASMGGAAQGPEALTAAVRERAARGAAVVKMMVSGGAMTEGSDLLQLQYTAGDVALVVALAHRAGLPVTAHAHSVPAVEACLAAGVDGIEHCTCLTAAGLQVPPRVLAALARHGTWVCPTLGRVPGSAPSAQALALMARTGFTVEARLDQVGHFAAAGVRLVSGSDAGIHPGKPHGVLPSAVAELVTAGLSPQAALASATSLAARACGVQDRTGVLRAGLDADLLLVDGDPTTRIEDLTRVHTVVHGGREVAVRA